MNQRRMWCVVKPTVGLPLFLGGVITVSLIVHAAGLMAVPWFAAVFSGGGG
ncbi:MAG: light-harvesting protein [Pseudomonadota bacterium]